MGNIEFPDVMLAAELHALSEDLLDLLVVVLVPVDPGLGHQDWDVAGMERRHTVGRLNYQAQPQNVTTTNSVSIPIAYNTETNSVSIPIAYNTETNSVSIPIAYNTETNSVSIPIAYNTETNSVSIPIAYNTECVTMWIDTRV